MKDYKQEKNVPFSIGHDFINQYPLALPQDVAEGVSNTLSVTDISKLIRTSKSNYLFFKRILDKNYPEIAFLNALNVLDASLFKSYLFNIIDNDNFILSHTRSRNEVVKAYLDGSAYDTNTNRFAYILCSGNENGELNLRLVKHLTPIIIKNHYLPTIQRSIEDGSFENNIKSFTQAIIRYAKTSKQLIHLYHIDAMKHFQNLFFNYLESMTSTQVANIVSTSLDNSEKMLSPFCGSRRNEVRRYQTQHANNPIMIVALVLNNGSDTSTVSINLMNNVLFMMKKECQVNIAEHPEYNLIFQYSTLEHVHMTLKWLKIAAKNIICEEKVPDMQLASQIQHL